MDEIFEISTENCRIPTCLGSQTLALAVLMGNPHSLISSTILVRRIIDIACLFIITIDIANFIVAVFHLTQQLTIMVIEIQVHPTRTITRQKNMTVGNLNTVHRLFPHVFTDLLLDDLLAHGRQRITHKNAQTILVTVQCVYSHLLGLAGHLQTGHIVIGSEWQLQLTGLTTGNIKTPY